MSGSIFALAQLFCEGKARSESFALVKVWLSGDARNGFMGSRSAPFAVGVFV